MTTHQPVQLTKHLLKKSLTASGKAIWVSLKLLYKVQETINKNVKENLAFMATLATTLGGFAAYDVQLEAAKIQANATVKAAEIQAVTSPTNDDDEIALRRYVDSMNALLTLQSNSPSIPAAEEKIDILLKSNSFTVLRNLQGKDKGTFVRFLAENGLIKVNSTEIPLTGSNLHSIDLEDAWLPDINLQGAYILDGNLAHTNLTRGSLRGAVLTGTDFTGAILMDTDFTDADLTGASVDVDKAIQDGANFCNATMPDGTKNTCL